MVIRLSASAPLLLALPDDLLEREELPTGAVQLFDQARQALGADLRELPGPVLRVPFDVLMLASVRDIAYDVANVAAALAELEDAPPHLASRYATFLANIADSEPERRFGLAMNTLIAVTSEDDLRHAFADYPELVQEEFRQSIVSELDAADDPEEGIVLRARLRMLESAADGNFAEAWEAYEEGALELFQGHLGPRIDRLTQTFDEAEERGDWDRAIGAGEELVEMASGIPEPEAVMSMRLAGALYQAPGPGQAARIERSIQLYERILEISRHVPELNSPEARADVLINLGAALGSRVRGDRSANQNRAIACQREALNLISIESNGDAWAMAQTNLGLGLLERAAEDLVGDDIEASAMTDEVIGEALSAFHAALKWRSFDRNPLDWAFTQINLGLAYVRRRDGDREANLKNGIKHAQLAAQGFEVAGNPLLFAQAQHNLSSANFDLAELEGISDQAKRSWLEIAADHARGALEARPLAIAQTDAGRTWALLGKVLGQLSDRTGAFEAYQRALEGLSPETDPRHCYQAAREFGEMAGSAGDWTLASEAWETAALAAAAVLQTRATRRGRFDELHRSVNVFRWAAYALVRAGRLQRAVEILELGRARELSTWLQSDLVDLEELRFLDPALFDDLLSLQAPVVDAAGPVADTVTPVVAQQAELFAQTIARIRLLPGFEHFLEPPGFDEVAACASPGEALCYMLTSPEGALALLVYKAPDSDAQVDVVESALTSTDVASLLISPSEDGTDVTGYIVAHSEGGGGFDEALEDLAALMGGTWLASLEKKLLELDVSHVCVIPIALMGLLPVHAFEWSDGTERRCLLDNFVVAFAPSARVRSVCVNRATRIAGRSGRLLAVGNPLPQSIPLPDSELEAEMVVLSLNAPEAVLLTAEAATKDAVVRAMPGSTHIHLACHGSSAIMDDALTAGLWFANDELLSASEILTLDDFEPRLVVTSACETGVIQGYYTADEALALSTVFIGAGAAGTIASLWSVDDYATALLMCRFYENLAPDGAPAPAHALREAQLWLRGLSEDGEEEYLASRPTLRRHRESRRARSAAASRGGTARPYGSLSLWGAFTATGA